MLEHDRERHDRRSDAAGASDRSRRGPGSPPAAGRAGALAVAAALAAALALPAGLGAQEGHGDHSHTHGDQGHAHGGLHFTHPMIAESITPDTKVRLDHQYFEFPAGTSENSAILEAEYAFSRFFSIEASLPYSYSQTEAGNAGAMLKFANYALEDAGFVLGYGVDMAFPTAGPGPEAGHEHEEGHGDHTHSVRARASGGDGGADIPGPRFHTGGTGVRQTLGSHEWTVGPFLNVGWKQGPVEIVGWSVFQIPFNHHEQAEVGTELAWNFSTLYHVSSRVQALLELDGSGGISGPTVGQDAVNLSPGFRVQILPDTPLVLGSSVGFPLANQQPFDVRWKSSVFLHFPG